MVYFIVVITEAREFAVDIKTFCQADVIAAGFYRCIFNGRQRVDSNRKSGYAICQVDAGIGIDKCHLCLLVVILIVHVVDDIHCIIIHAGNFSQHLLIVGHYLFELQYITCQHRNIFHHNSTRVFATSAINSK